MTPKKRILVVEDNRINREMLKDILEDRYEVFEAENGREALDLLHFHKGDVDLILLDVIMPVMDGFTFLNRVKSDDVLALIPVIVMTQCDREEDEVTALSHGAADFVTKPYRPQVLLHRVAGILNLRETAAMVNHFKYDRLTGLYSKNFFFHKAQEILSENPEREYNLLCSNIENFKLYNDAFGVPAGDALLKKLAGVAEELAGETGICGCFGADRFVFLQERKREVLDRLKIAEIVQDDRILRHGYPKLKWGVYEISDRSVPIECMCDRAFLAADSIKGKYNKWLAVYDDALRSRLLREQSITQSMESALEAGQFTVYLQPKYRLQGGKLIGAEALVRWIHPEWGVLSPKEFVPLFEKNGFITRLDRFVWKEVCAILRDWKQRGLESLSISVNISRADIFQEDMADTVFSLIQEYGLNPSQLHLELTESAYTENPDQIIRTVKLLRQRGFVVEMDDFGSGYSSLNMLNQMKMDVLKLDKSFIHNEMAKPEEQGILKFIISLARWLKLSVVAEGVETQEQLQRLREAGCDYVQGYFFAKPMPCEAFEGLLTQRHPSFPTESRRKAD